MPGFLRNTSKPEEALSVERQRFQTLAEDAPFGMVLIDSGDQFVYINPKFKELFGYPLREIPDGRTWFKKAFPDRGYRHQVVAAWIQDLQGFHPGEPRSRTFTATGKDGAEKIINFISVQLATGRTFGDLRRCHPAQACRGGPETSESSTAPPLIHGGCRPYGR